MAKRVDTGSAMDNLLQDAARKEGTGTQESPGKASVPTMEMCHIRFPPADLRKMQAFAHANSITLSSAMRMAVSEFMQRKGLK
jgi:hypothetical protein